MFGLFKKRIPAPEQERAALVRRMFLDRCESDPAAAAMADKGPSHLPHQSWGAIEGTVGKIG